MTGLLFCSKCSLTLANKLPLSIKHKKAQLNTLGYFTNWIIINDSLVDYNQTYQTQHLGTGGLPDVKYRCIAKIAGEFDELQT